MVCGLKEEFTIYDNEGEWGIVKGNRAGQYFRDRVIELTPCEYRFFEGLYSDCKEISSTVCKQISKLLEEGTT